MFAVALLALQAHCVQLLQTYKHSDLNVGTDCRSTPHTHLSGGWPSKPQNARFQANMARWRPAAAPANKYSRLPAQEASLCACLSSALLHRALLGTLRGLWLATSSSTGISFLAMVNLLPLVLGASAQQATHQLATPAVLGLLHWTYVLSQLPGQTGRSAMQQIAPAAPPAAEGRASA